MPSTGYVLFILLDTIVDQYKYAVQHGQRGVDALISLTRELKKEGDQEDLLLRFDAQRRSLSQIIDALQPLGEVLSSILHWARDHVESLPSARSNQLSRSLTTASPSPASSPSSLSSTRRVAVRKAKEKKKPAMGIDRELLPYLHSVGDVATYLVEQTLAAQEILLNTHTNYLSHVSVKLSRYSNRISRIAKDATIMAMLVTIIQCIPTTWGFALQPSFFYLSSS